MADTTYGNAVVVTATFKGDSREVNAWKLERAAELLGGKVFVEQVETDDDD